NRTVKRLYADDSADSRVKVGNRQAPSSQKPPPERRGFLHWRAKKSMLAAVGSPISSTVRSEPSCCDLLTHQTMIRKIGKNLPGIALDSFSPIFSAPS
ncbi:hypothetical protein K6Y57_37035, partial [Burkholderia cenocepacia]|nr:hypothetical protein [Burkholderia cenocepacia]